MKENGWSLTPEGEEFAKSMMGEIMKMSGMDQIIKGVKAKFASNHWILIEHNQQIEVWSIVDDEAVSILDDSMLANSHDEGGNLFPANDAIYFLLAVRLLSARDGKDDELSSDAIRIRKWLRTLPIDNDVIDGSCFDIYLRKKGIEPPEK